MSKLLVIVGILIAAFIAGVFLITVIWAWVVPDVFAGAVEQHILPASLTWLQALKLSLLLLFTGIAGRASSKS